MTKFIQKYRIFFILLSIALVLLGFIGVLNGKLTGLIISSIPGLLLGAYLYLTSQKLGKYGTKFYSNNGNVADELLKWHELKEKGVISNEEFKSKKSELMKE